MWSFKAWRRGRILTLHPIEDALWQAMLAATPLLHGLSSRELQRLRDWATLFLQDKHFSGAGGLVVTDAMRLDIAARACLLILNLDFDCYRGWSEIIVYPEEFVPEREYIDDSGIVHISREPLSGEAWLGGPVILAWGPAGESGGGFNVVLHEFAHKLDMLNGDADGFPPLRRGMSQQRWTKEFHDAYEKLCRQVERGEQTPIDPYAGESPAEFFAVLTEAFFEVPNTVKTNYPALYAQLKAFYCQDPCARSGSRPD